MFDNNHSSHSQQLEKVDDRSSREAGANGREGTVKAEVDFISVEVDDIFEHLVLG